ncbi:1-(5-phosphoribosyl)-5-[(5-phosphoribosylamino)methylideneamino]imidazole-4-carboxamide isomerase [Haloflavibacter putidus]|uniref:1-(5-phosphoribosyl)-5-[(5-phosphoribosylamino)methylideneamino] imidazole-4-carboxamide isomerase n=1 Tax=Haloflavibacter putidus TaxID=2576776 RepID=A0A507ZRA2_9FLAO|nr:1-(5-phosphoribosyl)-5-[(5-phosphoribosylamino)methylideneamino]imidazole-4-carboxamide isomerase [Haloflavibacter putidus]TQD39053.1 1-(5-phosphoribosyl)-5-[(5-phosphoribosylamino)methylideneamino]imidazole-4-carboxamide isomerase [Haloflavibacter putidus]
MRIIPAIDIIDGKCVRLTKGDYKTQKTYNENPVEVAKQFEGSGITYLHVVDLDGAKSGKIINYKTLEALTSQTNLKIDFGGGIKTEKDSKIAFESGVNQITCGSMAVKNPDLFKSLLKMYGKDKIILGADIKENKIAIDAWKNTAEVDFISFIKTYLEEGLSYVVCTDVSKDGMLQGPSLGLYQQILSQFKSIKLVASGGISNLKDLDKLKALGCNAAILGKAIYENKISLPQLEQYILKQ